MTNSSFYDAEHHDGCESPALHPTPTPSPAFHHNLHYPIEGFVSAAPPIQPAPGLLPPSLAALVHPPAAPDVPLGLQNAYSVPPMFGPPGAPITAPAPFVVPTIPEAPVVLSAPAPTIPIAPTPFVPAATPPAPAVPASTYPNKNRPNKEVAPGGKFYEFKVYVRCSDGQEKELVVHSVRKKPPGKFARFGQTGSVTPCNRVGVSNLPRFSLVPG
ncbi:hypothetical protein FRC09_013606 [Ceratobasidium sp. 395]|nr:hypothetical protein FRC09_013606 [Ceratobasidium sp. 395]